MQEYGTCLRLTLVATIHSNSVRPSNPRELFNLRHASARNVIERIFGILKRHFRILLLAPEYDMDVQARVPPALSALHNFIRQHDPSDIEDYANTNMTEFTHHIHVDGPGVGDLAMHAMTTAERDQADAKREKIAQDMWNSYQVFVRSQGDPLETLEG